MRLNRLQNTKRNLIAGVGQKAICLLLPFVFRTLMIQKMGVEYLGISSLFSSILNVLSLAELGFGSAMVYSMYEPIAADDTPTICALLRFNRKCYTIIGCVILLAGIVTTPFVPQLINGSVPGNLNIYILFLISLLGVGLSYMTGSYRGTILTAFQRNDVLSWINTGIVFFRYSLQIAVIIIWQNYYVFLIVEPTLTVIGNIVVSSFVKKHYPQYRPIGKIDDGKRHEIFTKVKSLFLYKIGNVVFNAADTIVISALLGLAMVTKYGNYYYIITVLFGFLAIYYDSIRAGIGNKMALEGKEASYRLFEQLLTLQGWLIGWMAISMVCMYQDFMLFWIKDRALLFDFRMVILFGVYLYTWKINDIVYVYKEAAGLWEYDRYCPLLSALCNLVLNFILVEFWGIYGILISTIVCNLTFTLLWSCRMLFKHYFKKGYPRYLKTILKFVLTAAAIGSLTVLLCSLVDVDSLIIRLIVKAAICVVIPNGIYLALFHRNPILRDMASKIRIVFQR